MFYEKNTILTKICHLHVCIIFVFFYELFHVQTIQTTCWSNLVFTCNAVFLEFFKINIFYAFLYINTMLIENKRSKN